MEQVQRVVEAACDEFGVGCLRNGLILPWLAKHLQLRHRSCWTQVPSSQKQAEATLLEFRQSGQPFAACQQILEHSLNQAAQFQVTLNIL